jgi:UDP-N-acetylmuramate dehydrogenase
MLENVLTAALDAGCEVKKNTLLSFYTTFKTGGRVSAVILPSDVSALKTVLKSCIQNDVKYFILGNGSNVLASDNGFDGVAIRLAGAMNAVEYIGDGVICAQAGATLASVCKTALENSLTGIEFAYGIPGTVGGAVFMNAGAYGGEMKDVVISASHIEVSDFSEGEYDLEQLELSYRHSAYSSGGFVITGAEFRLAEGDRDEIKAKMDGFLAQRNEKQPLEYPSAGSFFKRPEGNFAGALIEQCGLKGYTIGGAQVSEKHAGFIINIGGATTADILALKEYVQKTVLEQKGVLLEPEVRMIED